MAKGDTTPWKTDVEHLVDGAGHRGKRQNSANRVKTVPIDHRAVFEFTKGDDVSPHIVFLCRKYGVTPQEVVHETMRDLSVDPKIRVLCAKYLLDELRPKKDGDTGERSFTVVINHVQHL